MINDADKVTEGLEHCIGASTGCFECPYSEDGFSSSNKCKLQVDCDALELINELQEKIKLMKFIYGDQGEIVGELVKCKDCKHYDYGCKLLHTTEIDPDWFCADGEKKDG